MKVLVSICLFGFVLTGKANAYWSVSIEEAFTVTQACQLQQKLLLSWPDVYVYKHSQNSYLLLTGKFKSQSSALSTLQIVRRSYIGTKSIDVKPSLIQPCDGIPQINEPKLIESPVSINMSKEINVNESNSKPVVQQVEPSQQLVQASYDISFKATQQPANSDNLNLFGPSSKHDRMSVMFQVNGKMVTTTLRETFNHLVMLANSQAWREAYVIAEQLRNISPEYLLPTDLALLGWIHLNNKAFPLSKRFFELSLLAEEKPEVVYGLAMTCLSLNQYNQARQLVKRMPEGQQKIQVQQLLVKTRVN